MRLKHIRLNKKFSAQPSKIKFISIFYIRNLVILNFNFINSTHQNDKLLYRNILINSEALGKISFATNESHKIEFILIFYKLKKITR